jgi:hypothetical protein
MEKKRKFSDWLTLHDSCQIDPNDNSEEHSKIIFMRCLNDFIAKYPR